MAKWHKERLIREVQPEWERIIYGEDDPDLLILRYIEGGHVPPIPAPTRLKYVHKSQSKTPWDYNKTTPELQNFIAKHNNLIFVSFGSTAKMTQWQLDQLFRAAA